MLNRIFILTSLIFVFITAACPEPAKNEESRPPLEGNTYAR